jgi:subtilisin family serine protease
MAAVQRSLLLSSLLVLMLHGPVFAGSHWQPTGEIILRFEGQVRPAAQRIDRLARSVGVSSVQPLAGSWPLYRIKVDPNHHLQTVSTSLERQPGVLWAELDRWVELIPHGAPLNDPYWDQLWHLDNDGSLNGAMEGADIAAVPAWDWATGLGILAAVVDGGVDPSQPDLLQETGIDVLDDDTDASPDLSTSSPAHGTAVAGLIGAIGNNGIGVAGVAWQATILPVRLIGGSTLADVYDAFAMSADRGASVINNSWGYKTEDCGALQGSPVLDDALNYAHQMGRDGLGTSITFSMGNESCHDQTQPILSHPATIGVGAINKSSVLHGYSNTGDDVDIVAPSNGLRTTDIVGPEGMNGLTEDYTNSMGGTSGACPVVSGVIALMYEANPRLTADEVQMVLCVTADRVNPQSAEYDDTGWSNTYGCGRVDAAAAVAAVYNRPPSAPALLSPEPDTTVFSDEVLIHWEASNDSDGDPLRYTLELRPMSTAEGDDDDSASDGGPPSLVSEGIQEVWRRFNDGDLSPGHWEVEVWATDSWGRGAASEIVAFEVVEGPPTSAAADDASEDGGCDCQSGGSVTASAAFFLLVLPFGMRRVRT